MMMGLDRGRKLEDDFEFNNCVKDADIYIRMGFIRKVYSILSVQLLLTCVTCAILYAFKGPVSLFLSDKPYILIGLVVLTFALFGAMLFKRFEHPTNLILLLGFTFIEAFTLGVGVVQFDVSVILQAFLVTTVVTVSLTVYAMQTKRDFSSWGMYLSCFLMALLVGGISNLFFSSSALHLALSIGGAVLFSFILIYDTQEIMQRFPPEEYIEATITLYLDILNLFIYVLRIVNATNEN